MRLRKPCEHVDDDHPEGRYEPHTYFMDVPVLHDCPGGEFLPEGALRYWVTRTDGEPMGEFGGLMAYSMDESKRMVREELEIEADRIDGFEDEGYELPTYIVEVSAVVESITIDALASQVGESE